jgi:acyl-CoA synthetase (AMP-forming)/AMP-acid ligase II
MLALIARESAVLKEVDLTSIRQILVGSAPSSDALIEEIRRMFPNAALINSWGTTEAGPLCFGPHPKGLPRPPLSLGYPRPDVQVRLAHGPSPDEGVLQLRTPALMSGYLNRPEESAQRLKDGWYDTGDVMRRDADGFFWFVGRQDDMFICGGENIYPAEVEKLLESHPEIAQAAVVPVADAIKGQVPVAFVVRTPGSALDEEGVKQYALHRGPAYAHPRRVAFLSELPLAGTNKIDRKRLAQDAAAFAAARIGSPSTGGPRA